MLCDMPKIVSFEAVHSSGVAALTKAEGWLTFADEERVLRLFGAPGVVNAVAVDNDRVVGAAHALTDGHHAYLTALVVAPDARRTGVGRLLVAEIFRASGAERVDLLSIPEANDFYRSFPAKEFTGFRLYPAT
jgi:ribosomal protein S18 acetylase RimI-like enzyme